MKKILKDNLLTLATLFGVIAGMSLGVGLKSVGDGIWTERQASYVGYPGKIFLNMLKCVIIPLVVPSLIASIGSLDLRVSGRIGGRAVAYYMTTTVIAVTLGICLVVGIQPGVGNTSGGGVKQTRNVTTQDTLMDLVTNCFPANLVQSTMYQYRTTLEYPGNEAVEDVSTGAILDPLEKATWKMGHTYGGSTNILGLVVFSVATGVAISLCGEEGKPLLAFFKSVSAVMMRLTSWIVHLAPIGVCFLIAGEIVHMKSILAELTKLSWYLVTIVIGLSIQGGVILPLVYSLVTRRLPFSFIGKMGPALATAFGTASSSATLPVTINSLEQGNKIDPRVARFVLPIGATINMDGTALYEAVAAVFIAQMVNMNPSIGQIIIISITATAASIGAAGIPHAGLVTLVMVLETVGLPSESVAIIMSVDWLVDRFRTAINVLGDAFGAAIVAHLSKEELEGESLVEARYVEVEQGEKDISMIGENVPDMEMEVEKVAVSYCEMAGDRRAARCVDM